MLQLFLLSNTPQTKLLSWIEYKRLQNSKRKDYIISLLKATPGGLSCREISDISGIWIQSLTNPLKELEKSGAIKIVGVRKCELTNRIVQAYSLVESDKCPITISRTFV
jgi:predicted transcriptional regulator